MPEPQIDAARLNASIAEMATVGATDAGGVQRIALTEEDVAGRHLLCEWAEKANCAVRLDRLGNLFVRREGTAQLPPVAFGSHLDTQPDGGAFDGALGVLAGLEVLRALEDSGVATRAPLELVVWTDEEGARFDVSCVGSSVFAGSLAVSDGLALTDSDGISVANALESSRQRGEHDVGDVSFESYFELHIEQGPQLEHEELALGVVEGIFGIRWLQLTVDGCQSHAGTTPMDRRSDALAAAAALVTALEELGSRHGEDGRATVCTLDVEPNAGSVIPGRVRMMVDLRHSDAGELDRMQTGMMSLAERVCADRQLSFSISELWLQPPIAFDPACVQLVERAACDLGLTSKRMLSGAGHDAGYLAAVAPTAMIFVPCRGGVSHHASEYASPEAVANGTRALLAVVMARANAS